MDREKENGGSSDLVFSLEEMETVPMALKGIVGIPNIEL